MESEPISSQEVKEEIGGKLKSFHKLAKHVKRYLHQKHQLEGAAMSAGAMSAGALSAGGWHSQHHKLKHLVC